MGIVKIIMFSIVLSSTIGIINIVPQAFAHDTNPPTGDLCLFFNEGFFDPSFSLNHGTTGVIIQPNGAEFILSQSAIYDQNSNFPFPQTPGLEFGVDSPHFGLFTFLVDSDTPDIAVASGGSGFPVSTSGTIGTFFTTLEPSVPAGEYFVISCWLGFIDEGGPLVTDADLFGPFTILASGIPPSCGPGTTLNGITNECDPDVTQAQHDAALAALDAALAALADAQAQRDAILTTLFEFLRVFGVI